MPGSMDGNPPIIVNASKETLLTAMVYPDGKATVLSDQPKDAVAFMLRQLAETFVPAPTERVPMTATPNGLETATPKEVAEYLHTSEMGLAQLRYKGNGPKFVKIGGRKVIYRWSDVRDYLDANTLQRTDDSRGITA